MNANYVVFTVGYNYLCSRSGNDDKAVRSPTGTIKIYCKIKDGCPNITSLCKHLSSTLTLFKGECTFKSYKVGSEVILILFNY